MDGTPGLSKKLVTLENYAFDEILKGNSYLFFPYSQYSEGKTEIAKVLVKWLQKLFIKCG